MLHMKYKMKTKLYEPNFLIKVAFIICMIVSIIFYPFLPDDFPMQFARDGSVNWTLPKMLGILFIPAIAFFFARYYQTKQLLDYSKAGVLILMLAFDIGLLYYVAFMR